MTNAVAIVDLLAADSPEPDPLNLDQSAALLERVQRGAQRLGLETRLDWFVSDPSGFQDGALFTQVSTGSRFSPTTILVSKFGNLITSARLGDPPYNHSADQICTFAQLLGADCGFRFVHPTILNQDYAGTFSRYKVGTWFQRFFCFVYWTAGKAHQGMARWP